MITWRWACGTTRHSPISAAAFLRIRCAHCWLFLLGGLLGLGTLICAFCLGPLIQFFNTHVSENVLQYVPTGQQA